MKNNFKHSV